MPMMLLVWMVMEFSMGTVYARSSTLLMPFSMFARWRHWYAEVNVVSISSCMVRASSMRSISSRMRMFLFLSIDQAREAFRKVKDLTVKLSMVENAAYRLASNIKKTQKRANALQNITIPMYSSLVYTITNALEEKEREEFTRLKVIKRMKQKKG